jgi:hypothetical protein
MIATAIKPTCTRKYALPIALLAIALIVGAAPVAAVVSGSSHSHAQLHVRPRLDFGVLSPGSATMTFVNALMVGKGRTSSVTFAFVKGTTTWDRVFSGISIVVQSHERENSIEFKDRQLAKDIDSGSGIGEASAARACISLGTATCPIGLTDTFTPTTGTTYDYVVSFTTVPAVPLGITLQTTWSF